MRKEALRAALAALLLLAAPAPGAAKPTPTERRLLVLSPAVALPDDYEAVLKRASKARATLVVLPLRNSGGHEGAFEFAELALKSGLFAKVSVSDDLGKADYAVTGSWSTRAYRAGGGSGSKAGLGRWMYSGAEVKLDLLFEGEPFAKFETGMVDAELYLDPPFTPRLLAKAAHEGLHQAYRAALYRIAKDILKRSAR